MVGRILSTYIDEEDCTIEVTTFFHKPPHKGSPHTCDNPFDYYGYDEVEFIVKTGVFAGFVGHDLPDNDRERIEQDILNEYLKDDWRF